MEPHASPPHVLELAQACVQYVQRATGFVLDFHEDTLPVLDHYLRSVETHSESIRGLIAPSAGAYFGQVVRSVYPARWHTPGDDYALWRLEFEPCFLHFSPVAFAHEAMLGKELVEGPASFGVQRDDLPALRAVLDLLGGISEEDYFKLSTRFEVLSTVVDRLVASAAARDEFVPLGHDVYRSVLDDDVLAPS